MGEKPLYFYYQFGLPPPDFCSLINNIEKYTKAIEAGEILKYKHRMCKMHVNSCFWGHSQAGRAARISFGGGGRSQNFGGAK